MGSYVTLERAFIILIFGLMLSACGSARSHYLIPNYQRHERTQVVRVEVWVTPAHIKSPPEPKVLAMWSLMAQRYLNDKRDFLVLRRHVHTSSKLPSCSEGVVGRFIIQGDARRSDDDAQLELKARLETCDANPKVIWRGGGSFCSEVDNEVLQTLRAQYHKRFGDRAAMYAAPSFLALKELLDLTPYPKLTRERDIFEKIELDY